MAAAIGAGTQRRFEASALAASGGLDGDGFASPDWPTSLTLRSKSLLHLTIGVLGKTDRARCTRFLSGRAGDLDAIAHQIAVVLLDHVAEMNADAELDAALGRHTRRCAR